MNTIIFGIGPSQSNGVGKADFPQTILAINPNNLVFGNDYKLKIIDTSKPLDDSLNQIDELSFDLVAKYNFGIPFITKLQSLYQSIGEEIRIILVPCAKGGSNWEDWKRTSPSSLIENTLYWSLYSRLRSCFRPGYKYGGLLMALGESDAQYENTALLWGESMGNFVSSFRQDLANTIPILYAQLHHMNIDGELPYADIIRKEQQNFDGTIAKVKMVANPFENNYLHWSTYNTTLMGYSFANTWFNNYRM